MNSRTSAAAMSTMGVIHSRIAIDCYRRCNRRHRHRCPCEKYVKVSAFLHGTAVTRTRVGGRGTSKRGGAMHQKPPGIFLDSDTDLAGALA